MYSALIVALTAINLQSYSNWFVYRLKPRTQRHNSTRRRIPVAVLSRYISIYCSATNLQLNYLPEHMASNSCAFMTVNYYRPPTQIFYYCIIVYCNNWSRLVNWVAVMDKPVSSLNRCSHILCEQSDGLCHKFFPARTAHTHQPDWLHEPYPFLMLTSCFTCFTNF